MKLLSYIASALAALALAACGPTDVSSTLRDAEAALAAGDMTAARCAADHLTDPSAIDHLGAGPLARLSIVYMHLAEEAEDPASLTATAADLYRRASRENSDTVLAVYSSLPPDEMAMAQRLFHIVVATDSAGMPPKEEPVDSDSIAF